MGVTRSLVMGPLRYSHVDRILSAPLGLASERDSLFVDIGGRVRHDEAIRAAAAPTCPPTCLNQRIVLKTTMAVGADV